MIGSYENGRVAGLAQVARAGTHLACDDGLQGDEGKAREDWRCIGGGNEAFDYLRSKFLLIELWRRAGVQQWGRHSGRINHARGEKR